MAGGGFQETGKAIRAFFGTAVGGLPVYFEGQTPGEASGDHCQFVLRHGRSLPLDQGPHRDRVYFGSVELALRFRPGTSPKTVEDALDAVDTKFFREELFTTDGDRILFDDGGINYEGPSGDWHQVNYLVSFERDRLE